VLPAIHVKPPRRDSSRHGQGIEDVTGGGRCLAPNFAGRLLDEDRDRAAGKRVTIGLDDKRRAVRPGRVDCKPPDVVRA
jgi:hypothetical protein